MQVTSVFSIAQPLRSGVEMQRSARMRISAKLLLVIVVHFLLQATVWLHVLFAKSPIPGGDFLFEQMAARSAPILGFPLMNLLYDSSLEAVMPWLGRSVDLWRPLPYGLVVLSSVINSLIWLLAIQLLMVGIGRLRTLRKRPVDTEGLPLNNELPKQ